MIATIRSTDQPVSGRTLRDIYRHLCSMLRVDGPRGLTATTPDGAEIHAELYDGQDYIRNAARRTIYTNV